MCHKPTSLSPINCQSVDNCCMIINTLINLHDCKGVKQINNQISFKHLYHSYLSAFFISAGVPNGEFPEILIAKCRSRFYCTWFFCWGGLMSPAHETQSMREIRLLRGRLPRKGGGLTGMRHMKNIVIASRIMLLIYEGKL